MRANVQYDKENKLRRSSVWGTRCFNSAHASRERGFRKAQLGAERSISSGGNTAGDDQNANPSVLDIKRTERSFDTCVLRDKFP